MLAYATPAVVKALDAARQADDAARILLARCQKLRLMKIAPDVIRADPSAAPEAPEPDAEADAQLQATLAALEPALREAEKKDNELIDVIRDDLDTRPSQAPPSAQYKQLASLLTVTRTRAGAQSRRAAPSDQQFPARLGAEACGAPSGSGAP